MAKLGSIASSGKQYSCGDRDVCRESYSRGIHHMSPFAAGSQQFKFGRDPCDYFRSGKIKTIEMFNSLNALSEDGSLLTKPPWLLLAILNEWLLIAVLILIDEVLKFVGGYTSGLRYSAPTKTSTQKTE
ncbi:hypothetical protein GOBAR_AA38743 [Gossypium barbadense]|uniref:Uncharacterized protein n=1 Tax=Gossypium barbadense TaxID=3634 RepID=A0A2P5RNW1_GOSBA|nr:hypothetical protein GOBAR_DD14587 [Gossypium barbadense]PPR81973.1 hypothetical protein GOBAR_AA38743 [Gossypium barbadense]